VLLLGSPANAGVPNHAPRFTEVNLISDHPGGAPLVDPKLVNAWGLALSPTSPLWVANNGTSTSTIYRGGVDGAPVAPVFAVNIPSEGPTGQAFNDDASAFMVTGPGGTGPAAFLFDTEAGDIVGWNNTASHTDAFVVKHVDGAVYKGLAILKTPFGPFLLATNFHSGRIDVFDRNFHRVALPPSFFRDPRLPAGYAPFNVLTVGDSIYVAYAKQDPNSPDEVAGPGNGFVDRYTHFGLRVDRIASRGTLNAPWGLAIAPPSFGDLAGTLLVGNFGDGRISAYRGDHFAGQLKDSHGHPLAIDGLWALLPGTASTGGVANVWFSAGPADESQGLVGLISPAKG
jgi:uncharacterized protein (TIGR03118 family)